MCSEASNTTPVGETIEVLLDGLPVPLPPGRRSLTGIRSLLETLALQRQRVLSSFRVDGEPAAPSRPSNSPAAFSRVEGDTISLDEMPLQLLETALRQTAAAQAEVQSGVVLVLINDGTVSREFWWELAATLKEPLITLSIVPESLWCALGGSAPLPQLRKWQLEQLGAILQEVDEACWSDDPRVLSSVLEQRVLTWLNSLQASLILWRETALASPNADGCLARAV